LVAIDAMRFQDELYRKRQWFPTKYENHRGRWRAARTGTGVASRLMADLQARGYQEAIERYARGTLIDLGCGNAPLSAVYAPYVDKFYWADWPNSPHQKFDLDYEVDLNGTLPFEPSSFDTVLLSDVLEHIPAPDKLFGQIAGMLRPGGSLIVGVPFLYHIHEYPNDYYRYTRFKLERFGQDHDMEVLEIRELGGALDCLADLSGKLVSIVWEPLARIPYHAWHTFRSVPFIRRLNGKAAWKFPLAYIAIYRRPGPGDTE
jgi:SAM-dependent methyltransferase